MLKLLNGLPMGIKFVLAIFLFSLALPLAINPMFEMLDISPGLLFAYLAYISVIVINVYVPRIINSL